MSNSLILNPGRTKGPRDSSRGSRGSSPARGARSEAGYSSYSQKSTASKSKHPNATYPKKGSTLGQIELSPEEETHLDDVLKRFDMFKQVEEMRIRNLRDQLVEKQKSRIEKAENSGEGHCYNCGRLFMAVFNTPIVCFICKHEFCRTCMERLPKSKDLVCKFCRSESVYRGQLGVWFTEELKQARSAGRVRGVSGPEALRSSLIRLKRESRAASLLHNLGETGTSRDGDQYSSVTGSDYRTENWVEQAHKSSHRKDSGSAISGASQSSLNDTPRNKLEGSFTGRQTPSTVDNRRPASPSSVSGSQPGSHVDSRQVYSSMNDLRTSNDQSKPRLTSEAGSTSTWNMSSRGYGSMLSIYSEHESSYTHGIAVTGDLRLDILYDTQSSTLRIAVKQARDLAVADKKHQASNPDRCYVKAYLLPDKTKASKRKTSHKKQTRNPVFEEELKYRIPYSDLSARSLQISAWHKPAVGTNLFLGEVIIPFADFQFDAGPQWYPLSERRQGNLPVGLQIYRGDLLLALKLIPGGTLGSQSELHVWIKNAKGLTTSTSSSSKSASVNPYVKVYLLPDKEKTSKRKTKVLKKINNPDWDTNFVYKNIDRSQLSEMGLEVSIWDQDRMSANEFLGGCRINDGSRTLPWKDAQGTEQTVWLRMMEKPQVWFECPIRLRANLD